MKRGIPKKSGHIIVLKGKPKILGISSSNRNRYGCSREDAISFELLKLALEKAKKQGAEVELIDLKVLRIGPCKGCYSTCPAQCRFSEKYNMCDCYPRTKPAIFLDDGTELSLEEAYSKLGKKEFLMRLQDHNVFDPGDDMYIIYKAMLNSDAIIFAGSTNYYSRPALLQNMLSRLTALDGGVEELWGDGKNLGNSIKYAKNQKNNYEQRLYNKFVAFINSSKEGDSVTPNLMKSCVMMGMKTVPLGVAYHVSWYNDITHRTDKKNALNDPYTLALLDNLVCEIINNVKKSDRKYGKFSNTV